MIIARWSQLRWPASLASFVSGRRFINILLNSVTGGTVAVQFDDSPWLVLHMDPTGCHSAAHLQAHLCSQVPVLKVAPDPYDPGTLSSSANQCILGTCILRSNLSRKVAPHRFVHQDYHVVP